MNKKTNHKEVIDKNEPEKRPIFTVLTMKKELFTQVGEDLIVPQIKLGKTDEEILIGIFGKLSIPTISLRANFSRIKQI
jgi:hypothetical protein